MEALLGHLAQCGKLIHACVVHQRIQASERLLRLGKQLADIGLLRHVALHCDRLAALCLDLGNHFVRAFFAGRIVHNHRRAIRCQSLCNACANTLRRSSHDRYFIRQLSHVRAPSISYVLSFDISISI